MSNYAIEIEVYPLSGLNWTEKRENKIQAYPNTMYIIYIMCDVNNYIYKIKGA